MDWGRKYGWLWDSYHGTFDSWEFKSYLREQVSSPFAIVMSRSDFEDHLPPFGKYPGRRWKVPAPTTFGEWAAGAANLISRSLPEAWPA
jgi:hypothetical protein